MKWSLYRRQQAPCLFFSKPCVRALIHVSRTGRPAVPSAVQIVERAQTVFRHLKFVELLTPILCDHIKVGNMRQQVTVTCREDHGSHSPPICSMHINECTSNREGINLYYNVTVYSAHCSYVKNRAICGVRVCLRTFLIIHFYCYVVSSLLCFQSLQYLT